MSSCSPSGSTIRTAWTRTSGPLEWRPGVETAPRPLAEFRAEAGRLLDGISPAPAASDGMDLLRREYPTRTCRRWMRAAHARGRPLHVRRGIPRAVRAVAPTTRGRLRADPVGARWRCPGAGPVARPTRGVEARLLHPAGPVDGVFQTAVDACRARTREHLGAPGHERFTVGAAPGKSSSGLRLVSGPRDQRDPGDAELQST